MISHLKTFFIAISIILLFVLPGFLYAANCVALPDAIANLERQHGETTLWVGVMADNQQLVVLGNPDGSTYLASTLEQMAMCVDLSARKACEFPSDILTNIEALADKHETLPMPDKIGRKIGIRRQPTAG